MIETREPIYGNMCQNCMSKDNVKEIVIHYDGQGVVIRLCNKCRTELANTLTDDLKKVNE